MASPSKTLKRAKGAARRELIARAHREPLRRGHVLYEANSGSGMVCNPEALFRALLSAPDMQHLHHTWVLKNLNASPRVTAEFSGHPRVRFVRYQSVKYFQALATSEYLINNSTFPPEFTKRPEQVYLNTWHGTPLKLMGYDVPNGGPDTRNIIRNFVQSDFILSPNPFTTVQMLRRAYRLDGVYRGAIIEEGYPRIDRQFLNPVERKATLEDLRAAGLEIQSDERLLVVAPTWKGSSYYMPENDAQKLAKLTEQLQAQVLKAGWRVVLKVHPRVFQNAQALPELATRLVPDDIPTNRILGIADALITDYSSIFYDFEASGRPTIFYIPDHKSYAEYRGLYEHPDNWPGPIVTTVEGLIDVVNAIGTGSSPDPLKTHEQSVQDARNKYNPHDDGNASARVVDIVFRGKESNYNIQRDFSTEKTSLLIYAGGLLPNGISTSILNLLDTIDHDRFDVSVTYPYSKNPSAKMIVDRINPNVRLFPRIGQLLVPRTRDHLRRKAHFPWGNSALSPAATNAFEQEWRRCFGDSKFDHIVDFSGYSPQWAGLLASGPARTHSIWQHNDLAAEVSKIVGGKQPHAKSLPQVFELYSRYDSIVSVSQALSAVNQKNLQHLAPAARFRAARNSINAQHVLEGAAPDTGTAPRTHDTTTQLDLSSITLKSAVQTLIAMFGADRVTQEISRAALVEKCIPLESDVTTFITIGRMSPEKNQARLLEAFNKLQETDPRTRLVLVGSGPLESELHSHAEHLGISDSVVFAGQIPNPYPLLAAADCFVLSSDYEGQPMVILEALTLGLPIVTTGFDSVPDALPEGAGLVVDRDVDALTEGLRAFIRGQVPAFEFDPAAYNRVVMQEFLSAIGAV